MARDPDRDVEPAARDPGEEGTPPDAGADAGELTDDSATWQALPPGAAGSGLGATPPAAPRRPSPVPRESELSPAKPRGFAVTAWVWLAALLALGLGILVALYAT